MKHNIRFNSNKYVRAFLLAFSTLLLILSFQNCSGKGFGNIFQSGSEDETSEALSSGNGHGYDGFAAVKGSYERWLLGYTCLMNGVTPTQSYESSLSFMGTQQIELGGNLCSNSAPVLVQMNKIRIHAYNPAFAAYNGRIYEKTYDAIPNKAGAPYVHCTSSAIAALTGIDVVIRKDRESTRHFAEIYSGVRSVEGSQYSFTSYFVDPFVAVAQFNAADFQFDSNDFNLSITNTVPATYYNLRGHLKAKVYGYDYDIPMICTVEGTIPLPGDIPTGSESSNQTSSDQTSTAPASL